MAGLKDRLPLLKGRCGTCRFKEICGGSLRARAEQVEDDPWAADPGCYLTDEEIAPDGAPAIAAAEDAWKPATAPANWYNAAGAESLSRI
jgi:hypothetical protein